MQKEYTADKHIIPENPIILFDGVCGLCNRFVDIILHSDKEGVFRFSPLQGETAKKYITELPEEQDLWSIIYVDENGIYERSDASLKILKRLGGLWGLLSVLSILPKGLRDYIYRLIAVYRYKIFGKRETCRVPSEQEKERFLP